MLLPSLLFWYSAGSPIQFKDLLNYCWSDSGPERWRNYYLQIYAGRWIDVVGSISCAEAPSFSHAVVERRTCCSANTGLVIIHQSHVGWLFFNTFLPSAASWAAAFREMRRRLLLLKNWSCLIVQRLDGVAHKCRLQPDLQWARRNNGLSLSRHSRVWTASGRWAPAGRLCTIALRLLGVDSCKHWWT